MKKLCKFLFQCTFSAFFILLYLYWSCKHNTIFPQCISRQLVSCKRTHLIYSRMQLYLIIGFVLFFCFVQPLYLLSLFFAIMLFIFDAERYYKTHYVCTVMLCTSLVLVILLTEKWFQILFLLFICIIVGFSSKNLCCTQIIFLSSIIWLL